MITWNILDDLHHSDHFPIITKLSSTQKKDKYHTEKRFLLNFADWTKFSKTVERELSKRPLSENINKEANNVAKAIRVAANVSIPQASNKNKKHVPWWNKSLADLRSQKMTAWHRFRKFPTQQNLLEYKKRNAIFRREMKRLKKASFEDFAKSINTKSAPQQLWSKVRRLTNHHTQTSIYAMKTAQATITEPKAIAHLFAHNWSECSNDSNFPNQFKLAKNSPITPNQVTNTTAKKMENNISMEEMLFTLKLTKGKTPGFDRISYSMIKHLGISAKGRLLALYNNIFQSGTIPQNWKSATIISIPKPQKEPNLLESYRPISLTSTMGGWTKNF